MKKLSILICSCLLAGCQQTDSNADSKVQEAVISFMKVNANDPASYSPVRWGKEKPWQQKDVDRITSKDAGEKAKIAIDYMKKEGDRLVRMTSIGASKEQMKPMQDNYDALFAEAKAFRNREDSLLKSTDTTRLGTVVMHAFRSKNKMGALVLDSARFVVLKNGEVKIVD